jgi:hypothetical protein
MKIHRVKIWETSRIEVKFLFCIKALFAKISTNGEEGAQWEVSRLKNSHVGIIKAEDEFIYTKNTTLSFYSLKLGYKAMFEEERPKNIQW